MTAKAKSKKSSFLGANATIALNRRARFEYQILETLEAGLELKGAEVKSLRLGKASIGDAFAEKRENDIYLINMTIESYAASVSYEYLDPKRPRKLLLHRKQIDKLGGNVTREGLTLIPLKAYFNARGVAKIELGLAKGKKLHDKRETEKTRDWDRDKARLMRDKG